MIVSLEITEESRKRIAKDVAGAERLPETLAVGIHEAVVIGAEAVRERLVRGDLGLTMRQPGLGGLAGSVMGWMVSQKPPVGAVGVPANAPAAAYAGIHETGGTILPKRARALAVPVSAEARMHTSPRDMQGLELIPRKGRPPLLVRQMARRGSAVGFELHWVLLPSVTIRATRWLTRGVEAALGAMADTLGDVLDQELGD